MPRSSRFASSLTGYRIGGCSPALAAFQPSRGMTVREIQGHLMEIYGLDVSPDLISTVTDAVLETVGEWQNRPLEPMYPLVLLRCAAGQDPR